MVPHRVGEQLFSLVVLFRLLFRRAARVRESREPAPHMGRVSHVQTEWVHQIFPISLLTNLLLDWSHPRGIGNKIVLQAVPAHEWL